MELDNLSPLQIKNQKFPLEWYKENINLVDFASKMYDYQINFKHTSRIIDNCASWVSMVNTNTDDRIIVTLSAQNVAPGDDARKGHFYYKNTSPDSSEPQFGTNRFDQGSIFDFIQFRDQLQMGDCIRLMKKYLLKEYKFNDQERASPVPRLSKSLTTPKGADIFEHYNVTPIDLQKVPFYVKNMLNVRDIPLSVLSDVKFKNHIFFRSFVNAKENVVNAVCFPILSPSQKEVGFLSLQQNDRNNGSFKEILGNKGDGLWFSGFDKTKPLDRLIVTEAPQDALAHYVLNPALKDLNILYAATIGTPSLNQCHTLDKIVEAFKPSRLEMACDFDAAGQKFNTFLIAQMSFIKKEFQFLNVNQNTNKHHQACVNFSFSCGSLENNIKQYRIAMEYIEKINSIYSDKISDGKPYTLSLNKSSEKELNFSVNFLSVKQNWYNVAEFVHAFKSDNSLNLHLSKPVNKDWNDDLSSVKNLFQYYSSIQKTAPELVPTELKDKKSLEEFIEAFYNDSFKSEAITKKSLQLDDEISHKLKSKMPIQKDAENQILDNQKLSQKDSQDNKNLYMNQDNFNLKVPLENAKSLKDEVSKPNNNNNEI